MPAAIATVDLPAPKLSLDDLVESFQVSAKQAKFVLEFMVDLNGKQAAIRAGYSEKTAESQASRLLSNVKVSAAIAKARAVLSERCGITLDAVVRQLVRLGFSDPRKLFHADGTPKGIHELDDDTAAAIAGFEVETETVEVDGKKASTKTVTRTTKVKWADKKGPLELLGKHLGLKQEGDVGAAGVAVKVYVGFDPSKI